jgi:hypothetical protein
VAEQGYRLPPEAFFYQMTKIIESKNRTAEIEAFADTSSPEIELEDMFRDPTRDEIVEAFESLDEWVFDQDQREFQLYDHWVEHCMKFVLAQYLEQTKRQR